MTYYCIVSTCWYPIVSQLGQLYLLLWLINVDIPLFISEVPTTQIVLILQFINVDILNQSHIINPILSHYQCILLAIFKIIYVSTTQYPNSQRPMSPSSPRTSCPPCWARCPPPPRRRSQPRRARARRGARTTGHWGPPTNPPGVDRVTGCTKVLRGWIILFVTHSAQYTFVWIHINMYLHRSTRTHRHVALDVCEWRDWCTT